MNKGKEVVSSKCIGYSINFVKLKHVVYAIMIIKLLQDKSQNQQQIY